MSKTMILYFSNTGTTARLAKAMAEVLQADAFAIEAEQPYTTADLNWNIPNCRANQEQKDEAARPAYKGNLPDLSAYDTVIIGHPTWWGIPPKIIHTVVDDLDLSGKKVASFATSGGSSYYDSQGTMENWTGLSLPKGQVLSNTSNMKKWLTSLGL